MEDVRLVATRTHGRYLVAPPADAASPARALVGFHGYGQSAADMLDELRRLPGSERWLLASVQALHRFYNLKRDRIVASWMTREDREQAIADNVDYVAGVLAELERARRLTTLVYVGFSQGVAMAYRAAARSGHAAHGLIALGGDVPPDVRDDPAAVLPPVLIGRGETDTAYRDETFEADRALLESRGVLHAALRFAGGHEWTDAFRDACGAFLRRVAGLDDAPGRYS
jgi:predicted esterase